MFVVSLVLSVVVMLITITNIFSKKRISNKEIFNPPREGPRKRQDRGEKVTRTINMGN